MKAHILSFFSFLCLLLISASAQTIYPDNVMDPNCYTYADSVEWGIREGISSGFLGHLYTQPLVGDIDGDGRSEVVFMSDISARYTDGIVILDDQLNLKHQITIPQTYVYGGYPIAIADVDHDGIAEIFVYLSSSNTLRCYNFNGNSSSVKWNTTLSWGVNESYLPIIADINGDGIPEILVSDKIFNTQTGVLVVTLPQKVGKTVPYNGGNTHMPVFADMDNDGILEVVGGNNVIKVTITNTTGTAGNSAAVWKTIAGGNITDGFTAVADLNMDGFLDVVVTKPQNLYAWSPYSGVGSSSLLLGSQNYSVVDNENYSASRAMVADIDHDNIPEIVWSSSGYIQAVRYNAAINNFDLLWEHSTTDLSGATGMTAFDFNQDGQVEIVYRDQTLLRIIDGTSGLNSNTFTCHAGTATEYPIIVDLDRDGEAEIVVSENFFYVDGTLTSRIRLFKSNSFPWAPARYVWNQHGYNVVHVNNDLTVPQNNFNPATVFINTAGEEVRPFNNFLQQATTINHYGEPFMALPDLAFLHDEAQIDNFCDSMVVRFCFKNIGDAPFAEPIYYALYANDANGELCFVHQINHSLEAGDSTCVTYTFHSQEMEAFQPLDQLFVVLNNNGVPNNYVRTECDYTNNVFSFPAYFLPEVVFPATVCEGYDFEGFGFQIPADSLPLPGDYVFTEIIIVEDQDCDSVKKLSLTVLPTAEVTYTEKVCIGENYHDHGFSIPADSIAEPRSYTFTQTIFDSENCDSIKTLNLSVYPIYYQEISEVACNEYLHDGKRYTESGIYPLPYLTKHGCDSTVLLHLTVKKLSVTIVNEREDFCDEHYTVLTARPSPDAPVNWNTGEQTSSINVINPGMYLVTTTLDECTVSDFIFISECEYPIYIPNTITPSVSDGINDYFYIPWGMSIDLISKFEITIHERWGMLVFRSTDPLFRWDGRYQGVLFPNTSYQYEIKVKIRDREMRVITGMILVL